MEVKFLGIEKVEGVKKDGAKYGPIYIMHYLTKLENENYQNRKSDTYGFKSSNVLVPETVASKLRHVELLKNITLTLEPFKGDFTKTRIIDIKAS